MGYLSPHGCVNTQSIEARAQKVLTFTPRNACFYA